MTKRTQLFWCEACKNQVAADYVTNTTEDLSPKELDRLIDTLRTYHDLDNHLFCHLCGERIKSRALEAFWTGTEIKEICQRCAATQ